MSKQIKELMDKINQLEAKVKELNAELIEKNYLISKLESKLFAGEKW